MDELLRSATEHMRTGVGVGESIFRDCFAALLRCTNAALVRGFLEAVTHKGIHATELSVAIDVMREEMPRYPKLPPTLDVCGTGGSGISHKPNVSTAVAIVASGLLPVAKFGNHGSSTHGSTGVLEALGVPRRALYPDAAIESLCTCNLAFIHAPTVYAFPEALRQARREITGPTIFNLLGPLLNPVRPRWRLLGTSRASHASLLANELHRRRENAWVVVGQAGELCVDECSISGPTDIFEVTPSDRNVRRIQPEDFGFAPTPLKCAGALTPEKSAERIWKLLEGAKDSFRDMVVLNTAAALTAAGHSTTIEEGIIVATHTIDSKTALAQFRRYLQVVDR